MVDFADNCQCNFLLPVEIEELLETQANTTQDTFSNFWKPLGEYYWEKGVFRLSG